MPVKGSHRSVAGLAAAVALALGATGCLDGASHETTAIRPVIRSFTAAPASVSSGGSAILSWRVSGATSLTIDKGVGIVTGSTSVTVQPATTTTYTLSAANDAGTSTATATVTVVVVPPASLAYATNPAAYIQGVAIAPNVPAVTGGTPTSFVVSPALPAGLALDAATGIVSGTPTAVAATRAYTVIASNAGGSATASLTLTVVPNQPPDRPIVASFTATPADVLPGGSATLAWAVSNADTVSIDNGVGAVSTTGSTSVQPAATTTYTLTATNAAGTSTATTTVSVSAGPPTSVTYATNPASYVAGAAIAPNAPTIVGGTPTTWSVQPLLPDGLALDPVTGVVSGTPALVTPQATYTVTASNAAGSASVDLVVAVTAGAPPVITTQPVSQAVVPPATATFTVVATGNGTLSYQWQRNGADVPGAVDASYTTPATTSTDTGSTYRVVVSDAFGASVPSTAATLTVQGFSLTGPMATPREFHTATLLQDGRVLVAGGNSGTATLASAEIYDPVTGTFSLTTSPMSTPRQSHAAVLLADGKVLLAGGFSGAGYLATAEVFDPATGTFSPTNGPMSEGRQDFAAVLLPGTGGKVLVAGGSRRNQGSIQDVFLQSADVYDPAARTFTPTGSLSVPRGSAGAAALSTNRVLVAGGFNDTSGTLASAELFDPAASAGAGAFAATGSMATARQSFPATVLSTGQVLAAGGRQLVGGVSFVDLGLAETYDVAGTFAATAALATPRAFHTATPISAGRVLVTGGIDGSAIVGSSEIYDEASGAFTAGQPLLVPRYGHVAVPVGGGKVLVAGGRATTALSSAELWTSVP